MTLTSVVDWEQAAEESLERSRQRRIHAIRRARWVRLANLLTAMLVASVLGFAFAQGWLVI